MKKTFILLMALLFRAMNGFSHDVILVDFITQSPLVYATVYDVNGNIVGSTDENGRINLIKGKEYIVSHIGYGSKNIRCSNDNIITLSPAFHQIEEINVTAKKKKYYHCKVYFRSIEHVDSCLKYYLDGVREFFISTKKTVKRRKPMFWNIISNQISSK